MAHGVLSVAHEKHGISGIARGVFVWCHVRTRLEKPTQCRVPVCLIERRVQVLAHSRARLKHDLDLGAGLDLELGAVVRVVLWLVTVRHGGTRQGGATRGMEG